MSAKLEGMEIVLRRMAEVAEQYPEAMAAALYQEAEAIMTKSVAVCPVDTSALLQSRFVGRPQKDREGFSVKLGYGKSYAIYVHEMPSAVNWTRPGSGSKFLIRPVDEAQRGFAPRLSRRMRKNIAGGIGMAVGGGAHPEVPRQ